MITLVTFQAFVFPPMNYLFIQFEKILKNEKQFCEIRMVNLQIIEFSVIVKK